MGRAHSGCARGRRDDFVAPYFRHAKKDKVVVILKAREPARIMIAIGKEERWHLQLAQRWIVQYNFYINDQNWGRMFVRICPYLPFQRVSASINTTGWSTAWAPKASILSNVPMPSSNAVIRRSSKSWRIP
jgi:hypothetical protein